MRSPFHLSFPCMYGYIYFIFCRPLDYAWSIRFRSSRIFIRYFVKRFFAKKKNIYFKEMLNYILSKIFFIVSYNIVPFFWQWIPWLKKMFVLRRNSFIKSFFNFFMFWNASQQSRATSIKISDNLKKHSLINMRRVVRLSIKVSITSLIIFATCGRAYHYH